MNIIKLGGSIVNPDGKYDQKAIQEFIDLVKDSKDKFIFVVGGGKICRHVQDTSQKFLEKALDAKRVDYGRDWLGIATTLINADHVLNQFKEQMDGVYPEILVDPTKKVKHPAKVYFTGGWKPGCSTDKDMMLLAETFQATKVLKISDFEIVKRISPLDLAKAKDKKKVLQEAAGIKEMTWKELNDLVGDKWVAGLNTPFDPEAAQLGYKLRKHLVLYIGKREELSKMLDDEEFVGTIVKG